MKNYIVYLICFLLLPLWLVLEEFGFIAPDLETPTFIIAIMVAIFAPLLLTQIWVIKKIVNAESPDLSIKKIVGNSLQLDKKSTTFIVIVVFGALLVLYEEYKVYNGGNFSFITILALVLILIGMIRKILR